MAIEMKDEKLVRVLGIHTNISHLSKENTYHISFLSNDQELPNVNIDVRIKKRFIENKNPFSRREIEILRLLAEGLTTRKAAKILNISPDTVRTDRKNILANGLQ